MCFTPLYRNTHRALLKRTCVVLPVAGSLVVGCVYTVRHRTFLDKCRTCGTWTHRVGAGVHVRFFLFARFDMTCVCVCPPEYCVFVRAREFVYGKRCRCFICVALRLETTTTAPTTMIVFLFLLKACVCMSARSDEGFIVGSEREVHILLCDEN